jgi:hypothetical protein
MRSGPLPWEMKGASLGFDPRLPPTPDRVGSPVLRVEREWV